MPIIWREQMSVGNDLIDQDHRYLFCLINSIELALKHEEDVDAMLVFVQQLVAYTHFHFQREESIQKKALYPQSGSHQDIHRKILEHIGELEQDIREFHQHCKDGSLVDGEREMITQRIMMLLREWVLDHVLKDDKRMEPYLRKLPPNFE
jgi:hemerythrin